MKDTIFITLVFNLPTFHVPEKTPYNVQSEHHLMSPYYFLFELLHPITILPLLELLSDNPVIYSVSFETVSFHSPGRNINMVLK